MVRQLNNTNSGFTLVRNHVYVSNDLSENYDGSVDIKKWQTDYKKGRPTPIEYHFPSSVAGKSHSPWHPFFINRYISFSRFYVELMEQKFFFLSPCLWKDPYENVFYNKGLQINGKLVDVRCICTTYDRVDSEESSWVRGANEDGKIIRVSYKYQELCDFLNRIGTKNHCDFYISIVDYSQSKDSLIKKNKTSYSDINDYVKVLSLKRKAYSYENELRIIAVFEEPYASSLEKAHPFKLNKNDFVKMIASICLPPLKPFLRDDNRYKYYQKLQEIENIGMKKELANLLPGVDITQSRLYIYK